MRTFWGGKPEPPLDFDPKTDYYKVLDLTNKATEKDIKNMYYKKCYEYHPDRTGGMHQDKFKDINNAYQIIGDEKKKKEYDDMREQILNPNSNKSKDQAGYDFYKNNSTWQKGNEWNKGSSSQYNSSGF